MVTTGGVPVGGPRLVAMEPRLGVLTGEMWLVTGEETCDDSLLIEPEKEKTDELGEILKKILLRYIIKYRCQIKSLIPINHI